MEDKKLWALARITFAMVVLMGFVTVASLAKRGPLVTGLGLEKKSSRGPASIISIAASNTDEVISTDMMSTIDLDCLRPGSTALKSQSRQLRLIGKLCEGNIQMTKTLVRNRSNGFEATIFPTGELKFSTDYIYLSNGPNEIELSFFDEMGQVFKSELLVKRQDHFVLEETGDGSSGSRSNQVK